MRSIYPKFNEIKHKFIKKNANKQFKKFVLKKVSCIGILKFCKIIFTKFANH